MARRQQRPDRILQRYQAALAEFDTREPPLLCPWDNWPEAKTRHQQQQSFIKPSLDELNAARSHHRDGICHRARSALS